MKAVVFHELGDVALGRLETVPRPEPSAGEVRIGVRAVPVNFVDLVTISGKYQFRPSLPFIPGKGPAGVVEAIGAGVTDVAVGDRVLAMAEYGGYADAVVVDQRHVYRMPDGLSFEGAASMSLAFDTAWMALRDRARLAEGETVLVLGATGAVGLAAVQLARAMGAAQVIGSASSADKADQVLAAGADAVIDVSRDDLRDSIREQVVALVGDAGVDVVIDPLGGDSFDGAVRALAWRGRLVIVGFASGRIPTLKINYLMLKNIEVSGLQISDYRKRTPELVRTCFEEVFQWFENNEVRPLPFTTRPLAQWRSAVEDLESRAARTRLVLVPDHANHDDPRVARPKGF